MTNDLIYVYCLTDNPLALTRNLGLRGVESLMVGDFFVIIKYVPESGFSEENFKANISDIQWLESNAREHVGVITSIMESSTVIPFKFGTIFQSEQSISWFMLDYAASIIENFQHIEGKEEWAVKIYCDRKALSEQIDELSEEAAALEKQIMASSPGKAFLLRRKKADLTVNEMDRLCKNYGQEFYDRLRNLSVATSLNNLLPTEFTGRKETMILNAAFLVNKGNVADFLHTVDILNKRNDNSGFIIEATGPWPPFSFISIKEKP